MTAFISCNKVAFFQPDGALYKILHEVMCKNTANFKAERLF